MAVRNHFFSIFLVLSISVIAVSSWLRFMVNDDYLVAYQIPCDPAAQSCFHDCSDDACTTSYYYAKAEKRATDIKAECGTDISQCESATSCIPGRDKDCSITFCDVAAKENCDTYTGATPILQTDTSTTTP